MIIYLKKTVLAVLLITGTAALLSGCQNKDENNADNFDIVPTDVTSTPTITDPIDINIDEAETQSSIIM